MTTKPRTLHETITRIIQRVAELPDRTSPEDWPEAMLVTGAELQFIVTDEINEALIGSAKVVEGEASGPNGAGAQAPKSNSSNCPATPEGSRDE